MIRKSLQYVSDSTNSCSQQIRIYTFYEIGNKVVVYARITMEDIGLALILMTICSSKVLDIVTSFPYLSSLIGYHYIIITLK